MKSKGHFINCGGLDAGMLGLGRTVYELNLHGASRNVTVNVDGLSVALSDKLPPALIDLIEIATYVYAADRLIKRGSKSQTDMGEGWVRELQFRIPVRELETIEEITAQLESTLSFLSGDRYSFDFVDGKELPNCPEGLFTGEENPSGIQDVILFSGGLDSTAGAVQQAVVQKHRVALVHHQSITKFKNRISNLVSTIGESCTHKPLLLRIEASLKRGMNSREPTQRSRSFLYMTMGLAVARALGVDTVKFFENGPLSLNIPLASNIRGSRATRSTHPKVLDGFKRIARHVSKEKITVDNPFLLKTKTEVVQSFQQTGVPHLIGLTRSCAHTAAASNMHPHCGTCSQCIDRRFAIVAAKATSHERVSEYKVDPILGALTEEDARITAMSYVSTARKLHRFTEEEVLLKYTSVIDAAKYIASGEQEACFDIANLLKRHAKQVLDALAVEYSSVSPQIADGSLPVDCLLDLVFGNGIHRGTQRTTEDSGEADASHVFRRVNDVWEVRFQGAESFHIKHFKACLPLQYLLANPHVEVDAVRLKAMGARSSIAERPSGSHKVVDTKTIRNVKDRLKTAERQLEDEIELGATVEAATLAEEIIELKKYLARVTGKTGAPREFDPVREAARKSVSNALTKLIDLLASKSPELGEHLSPGTLNKGLFMAYRPAEPFPKWST